MATYSYVINFSDGEIIMLNAALLQMIKNCDNELSKETKAPYLAFKQHAEEVMKRLHSNVTQMSGNNFSDR